MTKTKQGVAGGGGVYEPGDELPPAPQDASAVSHLQLHIKTSLCPCQSYQCVITTRLAFYYVSGSPDKAREAAAPRVTSQAELFKPTIISS